MKSLPNVSLGRPSTTRTQLILRNRINTSNTLNTVNNVTPTARPFRSINAHDAALGLVTRALATLGAALPAQRPLPEAAQPTLRVSATALSPDELDLSAGAKQAPELSKSERRLSGALMRVNHVGEVCAQALYEGHALATKDPALRRFFRTSAQEEADHLAWTRERLEQLREHPSLLNPVWYAGALGIGYLAGRLGDRTSLGFMRETERQVEAHLAAHMERLPQHDEASRAIVRAMKHDEAAHAQQAALLGARELPSPVKLLMRGAARLMTSTAHVL